MSRLSCVCVCACAFMYQDVLIAFMQFMRDENPEAVAIFARYQASENQSSFTSEARQFLKSHKDQTTAISSQMAGLHVQDDPIVETNHNSRPSLLKSPERLQIIAPPGRNKSSSPVPIRVTSSQQIQQQQQNANKSPPPFRFGGLAGDHPPGLPPGIQMASAAISPVRPPGMMNLPHNTDHVVATFRPMPQSPQQQGLASLLQQQSMPPPFHNLLQPLPQSPATPHYQQQQQQQHHARNTPPITHFGPIEEIYQPSTSGFTLPTEMDHSITPPLEPQATPKPRPVYQPRRLWTQVFQQPGTILANGVEGATTVLPIQPRHELTAKWILPLKYIREHAKEKNLNPEAMSLREALASLTVGLFRRGCGENGTQASIISKEVLAPADENRPDYFFTMDKDNDTVWGTVPFYAPRTPGHVLFRLFWQDTPVYTLATGPTLFVTLSESDFEPTLRFILSNFKSKKGSATSLSSLNSLANVLEQFNPSNYQQDYKKWDASGRAAWGCVCESRKVLEVCASEYVKAKEKVTKLEEELEKLKALVDGDLLQKLEGIENSEVGNDQTPGESRSGVAATLIKEKIGAIHAGRHTHDRKWKDSQCAFAGILKAIVLNQNTTLLFRRELLAKIRLEYELWCPLSESFAQSPWNRVDSTVCVNFQAFPQYVTQAHYQECIDSRQKLQNESLGFVPNRLTLKSIVMSNSQPQTMNRQAVEAFNSLSGAMGQLFQDEYMVEDRIMKQRELVRSQVEGIVSQCEAFPVGTRVVIFGSAANGFGSPSSDLDMCLQLPQGAGITSEEDPTGALAMGKLAEQFEKAGLQSVDTSRLAARIPIIMSKCPRPLAQVGEDSLMECDLSMQNPLACLNTSLLLTYSRIHPVTRVLAAIIKRWAKARGINCPSKGTLSSYGYIIMLLHFLTYHCRDGTGLITTISDKNRADKNPLLPNLQWMDINWPTSPFGTPYKEHTNLPMNLMPHPIEPDMVVNSYFYHIADQDAFQNLQRRFPSQDLSLSILLASFFRYYAYEFDYKKFVVSLQATASNGMIEREVKAELNGWKIFSTGLAIEDPFEIFYDVAHVLKGYNFHRMRNEFALAYTKIADVATGVEGKTGRQIIDWICDPISEDVNGL